MMRVYWPTCAPSGWTGQQDATGQVRQPGFTRARKTGPAMPGRHRLHQLPRPVRVGVVGQRALALDLRPRGQPALPTWTSSAPPGSVTPSRSNAPSSTASW